MSRELNVAHCINKTDFILKHPTAAADSGGGGHLLIAPMEKASSAVTEQEPSYAGCLNNMST